ncbi:WXG100 family type VII secretion target [Acrocarpospora catenulata]|uniref:WXG100 family type VII secretion target n=1 Tax=Acrocarpospora catenulata TaxID=2836182 RepID=UPI001BDA5790|nr:hypothetical protein [Acrocarpospora catenulata]
MVENPYRVLHEAVAKEALATVLESRAGDLEAVFRGVPLAPGGSDAYWTGAAAERFANEARPLARDIVELAEACRSTAQNLRRSAERIRATAMLPSP